MDYKIGKGRPYPLGVQQIEKGIHFAIELVEKETQGIILRFKNKEKEIKIPFKKENKIGTIFCGIIIDLKQKVYTYTFYQNDKLIIDPSGKGFLDRKKYGISRVGNPQFYYSQIIEDTFQWENDSPLQIPYEDSVIYSLHVRGFTKHKTSNVKHKGTYAGLIEKITYLKELGITAVELLPSYEFEEVTMVEKKPMNRTEEVKKDFFLIEQEEKLNYWGFKEGSYFAPKQAYSSGSDSATEFKNMIKELHQNKIEIIMDFYFPKEIRKGFIVEVLKFWVIEYHVDGFHLMVEQPPLELIATEPVLADTKLIHNYFPTNLKQKNLGICTEDFMIVMRKFLKSDENMLLEVIEHMKGYHPEYNRIHTITNYNGFTLQDLVSYDFKHNEANGENNQDGNHLNYSWNCGIEGKTRKKVVTTLRQKQVKNALLLFLLSKGTPLLVSGDEFGNTQDGNNNPYCHDNKTTWINWSQLSTNQNLFQFTKKLLELRKNHPILHQKQDETYSDIVRSDYPAVSYHGKEAWKSEILYQSKEIGIMYYGAYRKGKEKEKLYDHSFYIAYNLHWEANYFALPKLPYGQSWYLLIDSSDLHGFILESNLVKQTELKVIIESRTICVLRL